MLLYDSLLLGASSFRCNVVFVGALSCVHVQRRAILAVQDHSTCKSFSGRASCDIKVLAKYFILSSHRKLYSYNFLPYNNNPSLCFGSNIYLRAYKFRLSCGGPVEPFDTLLFNPRLHGTISIGLLHLKNCMKLSTCVYTVSDRSKPAKPL